MVWNELGGWCQVPLSKYLTENGSFLTEFPLFVASSARIEEKSSCFGHVKIHPRITEVFLLFSKGFHEGMLSQ